MLEAVDKWSVGAQLVIEVWHEELPETGKEKYVLPGSEHVQMLLVVEY